MQQSLIQASSAAEAMGRWIVQQNSQVVLGSNGSVEEAGRVYSHPLAYIEAKYKTIGEWQIRELPEWVWQDEVVEAFCGESEDGPASVVADCRTHFAKEFPRRRASAFLWYLKAGALVTFYQKKRPHQMTVLRRYFWNWTGTELIIRAWEGGYEDITAALLLEPPRLKHASEGRKHRR